MQISGGISYLPDNSVFTSLLQAFGEEAVRDAFPDATIVRPADVYGHEDRFLRYYANLRVFPFGMIPMLRRGYDVIKRPVYVSS